MAEETAVSMAVAGGGDATTYSQAYVDDLKAQLLSARDRDTRLAFYEQRDRDALKSKKCLIEEYIAEEDEDPDVAPMKEWAKSLDNCANLETTLPLAKLLHNKANKWKRTIDEASSGKRMSEELAGANRRIDELVNELDATKKAKIDGDNMIKEKNDTIEQLMAENGRAGIAAPRKWNFSQRADREASGSTDVSMSEARGAAAALASSSRMAPIDPLLEFIKMAAAPSSSRMMNSHTDHPMLGMRGMGGDASMIAANGKVA